MCIALPNAIFVIYWLYNMRIELLKEVYRMNVRPLLFKILAFQKSKAFYDTHMKLEEERAKETK